MKKLLILFLIVFAGCEEASERLPVIDPAINKVFVNSDANGLFTGAPIKLWVELKDLPTEDGWTYDFILDGTVLHSIPAKSDVSWVSTFHEFTPEEAGSYTYKGELKSGSKVISEQIVFEVKNP